MDFPTGYGQEWATLRKWPVPESWFGRDNWQAEGFRHDMLQSADRAYFNFENEESIGQPNWNLRKGKPTYRIHSYEWDYDKGSIGRRLNADEWEESQAWQAFSAYEAIRKQRVLDYDGFAWCSLRGGGNTGTYQKPLVDYYDHAKLGFYAVRMAYQDIFAGSDNVDIVYGPDDLIPPVVINLGDARTVDLRILVKNEGRRTVDTKAYRHIGLPGGRSVTALPQFRPNYPSDGYYTFEYVIEE